ncbi:MAG: ankyrin repeat domain-containing protein [Clostridia bacterium]|nr:ankyrin repeat domain-containing protein [Clostridia bacterium]
MKKKFVVAFISIVYIVIIGVAIDQFSNIYYSKRLVKAIEAENIQEINVVLDKKPSCVNTVPTWMPKWFLVLGESPPVQNPLAVACEIDNMEIVSLLLERGAAVNFYDGTFPALSYVYRNKREHWYEMSLLLIENGASLNYSTQLNREGVAVFADIARNKPGTEVVPNDTEEKVYNSFVYAVEHCDQSQIDWSDVLRYCVEGERITLVAFLFDEGYCDVDTRVYFDTRPLIQAAYYSSFEMVEFLLERGANRSINEKDSKGDTALMWAARDKEDDTNAEIITLLLEHGADKNIRNAEGKTAYDIAVEYENQVAMDLLKN